jgi:hypothetical protein
MKNVFAIIFCTMLIGCTGSTIQIIQLSPTNGGPCGIFVMPMTGHGSGGDSQQQFDFDTVDQENLRASIIGSLKISNPNFIIYDVKETTEVKDSDGTIIAFPIGVMKNTSYMVYLYLYTAKATKGFTVSCIIEGKLKIYNSLKKCIFSKDLYIDKTSAFSVSDAKNIAIGAIVLEVMKDVRNVSQEFH